MVSFVLGFIVLYFIAAVPLAMILGGYLSTRSLPYDWDIGDG